MHKLALKYLLSLKHFNKAYRYIINPFVSFIPENILIRLPVNDIFSVNCKNGQKLLLNSNGYDAVANHIYWKGIDSGYESETISVFIKLLRHSHIFFDIGANTGIYSLIAALNNNPITVHSFEPVPFIFQHLNENISLNKLTNVFTYAIALSNFDGQTELFVPKGILPTSASTLKGFMEPAQIKDVIMAQAMKLDTFVKQFNVGRVDLLKIDTEGTEDHVIRGALNLIEDSKPVIICEILRRDEMQTITDILGKFDYAFFHITDRGLLPNNFEEQSIHKNYLFIANSQLFKLEP